MQHETLRTNKNSDESDELPQSCYFCRRSSRVSDSGLVNKTNNSADSKALCTKNEKDNASALER